MANSTSIFDNYVKEAKTLSSMKSFFSAFEGIGKGFKAGGIKGLLDSFSSFYNEHIAGINSLDDLLDKFGVTADIDRMKGLLQNQFDGLMSKIGNSIGPAYNSFLAALNISDSEMRNLLLLIKPFILNEEVLLKAIKKVYYGLDEKPDINFNNNLTDICLINDFPLILGWIDSVNSTTYSIREKELLNRADFAAKNGSYRVVHYMMEQLTYSYKEFSTMPAVSKEDKDYIDNSKMEYEEWSINTFKKTIINSNNNFTVTDYRSFLDEDIIPIFVSSYGTSDDKYHKRFLIKEKDLDSFVPIYKNETAGKTKTYILPKNKNIKKLYVSMANETNDEMINQEFHDRLDYSMFTAKEKAYDKVNDVFGGKPESIVKYAKDFLFNFNSAKNQAVSFIKENEATISSGMSTLGLNYDDFEFILETPDLTLEGVSKKIIDLSIEKGKQLFYNETTITKNEIITVTDPETGDTHTEIKEVEEKYIIITDKEIITDTPEQKQEILNDALAKELIDEYVEEAKKNDEIITAEDLSSMYPSLTEEFKSLEEYVDNSMKPTVPTIDEVPVEKLDFYTSIQNADGSVDSIEDVGIVKSTPNGNTSIIGKDIDGIPLGLSNDKGKLVVISKNNNTNEIEINVENPETGSFDKTPIPPEVSGEVNIIDGLGISSATNIIYYKASYYDDKLFTIETKKETNKSTVAVYDKLDQEEPTKVGEIDVIDSLQLDPEFKEIEGISFLANGKLYPVIKDYGVIQVEFNDKFVITDAYEIGEYTEDLMINNKNVGTIFNSVDINVNDLYDFDIDDPKIVKSILNYYNKNRELIYHLKIENGVIDVKRERDEWKSKEPYDKYSDEKDNSYRRENDYHGISEEIEHTVYYESEDIFNKYTEIMSDPTKTEDDNPGFAKEEEINKNIK